MHIGFAMRLRCNFQLFANMASLDFNEWCVFGHTTPFMHCFWDTVLGKYLETDFFFWETRSIKSHPDIRDNSLFFGIYNAK